MIKHLLTFVIAIACQSVWAAEFFPNDPTQDSAPAIQEYARAGKRIEVTGYLYCHATIDSGSGVNGRIEGMGCGDFARADGAYRDHPATVIVDARPKENTEPLVKVRRGNFTIENVMLVGIRSRDRFANGDGPIIEKTQKGAVWPVGGLKIRDVVLTNAEIGLLHSDNGTGGGHCDHTNAEFRTHQVDYPVVLDDNQSVNHYFDIFVAGDCRSVIWAKQGGKARGHIATNGRVDHLLLLGTSATGPTKNNGYFNFSVSIDGGDKVGSLVQELYKYEWSRPIVHLNGFAADNALLGEPVLLNKARVKVNIQRVLKPDYVWESN